MVSGFWLVCLALAVVQADEWTGKRVGTPGIVGTITSVAHLKVKSQKKMPPLICAVDNYGNLIRSQNSGKSWEGPVSTNSTVVEYPSDAHPTKHRDYTIFTNGTNFVIVSISLNLYWISPDCVNTSVATELPSAVNGYSAFAVGPRHYSAWLSGSSLKLCQGALDGILFCGTKSLDGPADTVVYDRWSGLFYVYAKDSLEVLYSVNPKKKSATEGSFPIPASQCDNPQMSLAFGNHTTFFLLACSSLTQSNFTVWTTSDEVYGPWQQLTSRSLKRGAGFPSSKNGPYTTAEGGWLPQALAAVTQPTTGVSTLYFTLGYKTKYRYITSKLYEVNTTSSSMQLVKPSVDYPADANVFFSTGLVIGSKGKKHHRNGVELEDDDTEEDWDYDEDELHLDGGHTHKKKHHKTKSGFHTVLLIGGGDFYQQVPESQKLFRVPVSMTLSRKSNTWTATHMTGPQRLRPLVATQLNGKTVVWGIHNLYYPSPDATFNCFRSWDPSDNNTCHWFSVTWVSMDLGNTWTLLSHTYNKFRVFHAVESNGTIVARGQDTSTAGVTAYGDIYKTTSPLEPLEPITAFDNQPPRHAFHGLGIGPNGSIHAMGWTGSVPPVTTDMRWAFSNDSGATWHYKSIPNAACTDAFQRDLTVAHSNEVMVLAGMDSYTCYINQFSPDGFPVLHDSSFTNVGMSHGNTSVFFAMEKGGGLYHTTDGMNWDTTEAFQYYQGTPCVAETPRVFDGTTIDGWLIYSFGAHWEITSDDYPFNGACAVRVADIGSDTARHYVLPRYIGARNVVKVGMNQYIMSGHAVWQVQYTP